MSSRYMRPQERHRLAGNPRRASEAEPIGVDFRY
jgi:hypothetical protein